MKSCFFWGLRKKTKLLNLKKHLGEKHSCFLITFLSLFNLIGISFWELIEEKTLNYFCSLSSLEDFFNRTSAWIGIELNYSLPIWSSMIFDITNEMSIRNDTLRKSSFRPEIVVLWINFTNILWASFTHADPKSAKSCLTWLSFLCFWDLHV